MRSKQNRRRRWADPSLLAMSALLTIIVALVFREHGVDGLIAGAEGSARLLRNTAFILLGIGLAGMLTVLVPPDMIGRWMGEEAGLLGVAVGLVAGVVSPGGPHVTYPIAAALMTGGAGVGPMAGFLAMRNVVAAQRLLVWDLPFLGGPFTFSRVIASVAFPFISVMLVPVLFRLMPRSAQAAARHRTRGLVSQRHEEDGS